MARAAQSGVVVRPARLSDYADVVDMSRGLFDGYDYMTAMFPQFMHDTSVRLWVAEVNGKAVSSRGTERSVNFGSMLRCRTVNIIQTVRHLNMPLACRLPYRVLVKSITTE